MSAQQRVDLAGAPASPYTQKMVALMRYRWIPYAISWEQPGDFCDRHGVARPRPTLMPTFLFPAEGGGMEAVCDSTPVIRRLESVYPGRSVLPADPALAFIDYLLEDFADEWCTKYMFHFRWHLQRDADNAGTLLPLGMDVTLPGEQLQQVKAAISERQVGRLYVVGSSEVTAPIIDASYRRFLTAMENHLQNQQFMLGGRPAAGDFALYGQLSQLVGFDPSARDIAHEISPRTVAWVQQMCDQSGHRPQDSQWIPLQAQPQSLRELLAEIGRVYAPAQLLNARALAAGEKSWQGEVGGQRWTQPTFPYQAKCLQWSRDRYRALAPGERAQVDAFLAGTGVEAMFDQA